MYVVGEVNGIYSVEMRKTIQVQSRGDTEIPMQATSGVPKCTLMLLRYLCASMYMYVAAPPGLAPRFCQLGRPSSTSTSEMQCLLPPTQLYNVDTHGSKNTFRIT